MQSGNIVFNAGGGGNRVDVGSARAYNDGEWHHIAVSFSRTDGFVRLYVDGEFRNEKSLASLGDITNTLDVVIGADAHNDYPYEGIVEEVRFWSKAMTIIEIRENMHLIKRGCVADRISYYPLDGTDATIADEQGIHNGTLTNGTHINSTAPIGPGNANSQTETNGSVIYTSTDLDVVYNTHDNADITASRLNLAPYGNTGIEPSDILLNAQYWIMNHYENTGNLNFNATFYLDEDITGADAATPNIFNIYTRNFNSDTEWTLLTQATSADDINNTITFNDIPRYGQFLLTKGTPTYRVTATIDKTEICKPDNINILLEVQAINGYIPTNPVSITVSGQPGGTTIVLSSNQVDLNAPPIPVSLLIENTQAAANGAFTLTIDFNDGIIAKTETFDITIGDNLYDGLSGTALSVDGSGDFINFGNQPLFDFGGTKNFTFEVWVKPNVANASGHIFSKYNRFIVGQYFLGLDNGVVVLQREVAPYTLAGTQVLLANQWYHIAGTYDGTEMKIYIDGVLNASQVSTGSASNNSTIVTMGGGYYNNAPGYFLNAEIDELRIWSVARTEQQIRENKHLTISSCESNLIANIQINEASGDIIDAASGITGTLNGDASRVIASEPLGRGYSYTEEETSGATTFYGTDCIINYSATTATQSVISKIENPPYNTGSIPGDETIWNDQYWVFNRYGSDAFLGDITLYPNEIVTTSFAPIEYYLYGRDNNAFGDWTFIASASNIDVASNSLTFQNVSSYGQYLITQKDLNLPLELLSFTGEKKENIVELNWITTNEINVRGFEIQRKTNNNNFETIGWVDSKGENIGESSYEFEDRSVDFFQDNYYRLKIIDYSGEYEFSNVIHIEKEKQDISYSIHPNPFQNLFYLNLELKKKNNVSINIYNALGVSVLNQNLTLKEGSNQIELNLHHFPSGVYWLKISNDENIWSPIVKTIIKK